MLKSLTHYSPSRSVWSYHQVQRAYGRIVRNRQSQLATDRVKSLTYLDLGCGPNLNPGLINLDYLWRPGVDVCWDITKGLPFADGSMHGIFSEHCLEHFPLPTAASILRECHRVLAPGGRIRVIVPDAGLYLAAYAGRGPMPYGGHTTFEGIASPILDVNRVFYQDRASMFGHWFIYDFDFLSRLLAVCGFSDPRRTSFRVGSDPALLVDTPSREVESLYVEASR